MRGKREVNNGDRGDGGGGACGGGEEEGGRHQGLGAVAGPRHLYQTYKESRTGQRTRETHNSRKVTPCGRTKKTKDSITTHRHTHKRIQTRACFAHPLSLSLMACGHRSVRRISPGPLPTHSVVKPSSPSIPANAEPPLVLTRPGRGWRCVGAACDSETVNTSAPST